VQLKFTISDPSQPSASPQDILQKFAALVGASSPGADDADDDRLDRVESGDFTGEDDDAVSELDDSTTAAGVEKKKKRRRMRMLKKKAKEHGYEFSHDSEIAGVLFVEIQKICDLPPEKNSMVIQLIYMELYADY
jgi:phosphatidylserine decarboxylase